MKRYRKKILVVLGLFLILLLFVGSSYAFWKFSSTQENESIAQTKCFRLTIMNESDAIFLSQVIPTSDEEGMKEKGYSFTIKNVCNTTATYQVNLEDLVSSKKLSQDYIRISLNESTPSNLSDYTPVKKTLEEAESSHKLTSGSLRPEEEVTYELKMWMDENTPALESVMNATFESKVTIVATYTEEEKLENEIELIATSANEGYSKEKEVFDIKASSVKYDIISYSEDKKKWTNVTPSKDFSLKKEYIKEGSYLFYVKDSVGNIKEIEIHTDFLDQTGPEIKYEENHQQESVLLSIFGNDEKSGIKSYQITSKKEEPSEWKEFEGETEEEILENGTYYIWMKDKVGNVSFVKYEVENIDQKAPEVTLRSELKDFGIEDCIEIVMKDDIIGLFGYQVMREEKEPEDWILLNQELSKTVTYEVEENGVYYVYVKDAYGHIAMNSIEITFLDKEGPNVSFEILESTMGRNGWYHFLKLSSHVIDEKVLVNEVRYCITTEEECVPNQVVRLVDHEFSVSFESNKSSQRICVESTDSLGNSSLIQCSSSYQVDFVEPEVSFTTSVTNNHVLFQATASDEASGISSYEYSLDNSNWYSSESSTYTFTDVSDGRYTAYVRVYDISGNSKVVSKPLGVAYDAIYVADYGSDENGDGTKENPYSGIQKAYQRVRDWGTIYLLSNIVQTSQLTFSIENKVTILRGYDNQYSIYRDQNFLKSLISLTTGTVYLTNIILDGNYVSASEPLVYVWSATLEVNENAILRNAVNTTDWSAGGVNLDGGAILNINGGRITGNKASIVAGAVKIMNSTLNLNWGSIDYNETLSSSAGGGGAIYMNGVLNVSGGAISRNISPYSGGAIFIGDGSTFSMTNGEVNYNTAQNGGAITVYTSPNATRSTLDLNGGEIAYNTASLLGGGINLDSGTVMVNGVLIHDNEATRGEGGGIYVNNNSTLNFYNGQISLNKAGPNVTSGGGGGVFLHCSNFTMTGGYMVGNTATYNPGGGGGLYAYCSTSSKSTVQLTGGYIDNNTGYGVVYQESTVNYSASGIIWGGNSPSDILKW